jgi:hypothetical protein
MAFRPIFEHLKLPIEALFIYARTTLEEAGEERHQADLTAAAGEVRKLT